MTKLPLKIYHFHYVIPFFQTNIYYNKSIIQFQFQFECSSMRLKAKIIGHQNSLGNKILYIVEVQDELTRKTKTSKLRYSEFKDIHDELQKAVSKLKLHIMLPQFPGRKIFGSTNKSQESIYERKKDLTNYLADLLILDKLHCLETMKKYFVPDELEQSHVQSQELNMQICIDRYTLVQDVVIYYVRLRDLNSHQQWTFKTRYSELRSVHEALTQSSIKNLPIFPKKKIFGITNESPEDIQKRRQELEKYFSEIFSVKEILNSDPIKYFVEESKKQAQRDKELEAMRKNKLKDVS